MHFIKIKSLIISLIIASIYCFSSFNVKAQLVDFGQNPPGLKWMFLETDFFKIIYPMGMELEAQRMANTLEHIYPAIQKSLPGSSRKTAIILQNQSVISNGFVTLAPRHSEFFTTPPQDFEPADWLNLLAVHEIRHIVQIDKTIDRFNIPLFEEGQFGVFGLTFPIWFIEGDATVIETALSNTGRGRQATWEKEFRANLLSGNRFSYSKNYFGSLKDNIPDFYRLGYFMSAHIRRNYGDSLYNQLFERFLKRFPLPYPFSRALKQLTGKTTAKYYQEVLNDVEERWKQQAEKTKPEDYSTFNVSPRLKTDYSQPHRYDDEHVLVLKSGLGTTPRIIKLNVNTKKEETLVRLGFQTDAVYDYVDNLIVWPELRFDPRYSYRTYSVLNTFDLNTKKKKQLTHKSRLFSPVLSPDKSLIAAVNISLTNKYHLVLLDAKTGKIKTELENPENIFYQFPVFNEDGTKLASTFSTNDGRSVIIYDLNTGNAEVILPFTFKNMTVTAFSGEEILITSDDNGIDNIYHYTISTKRLNRISNSKYGATDAQFDAGNKVLFNQIGVLGAEIAMADILDNDFQIEDHFIHYTDVLIEREAGESVFENIPQNTFTPKKYSELQNLFNFHSVSPFVEDLGNDDFLYSLELKSDNLLNTTNTRFLGSYNTQTRGFEYGASLDYKKYYPQFSVSYLNRKRLGLAQGTQNGNTVFVPFNFRQNEINMAASIPLSFSTGSNSYSFVAQTSTSYTSRYNVSLPIQNFRTEIKFPLKYNVGIARASRRSARDLAFPWSQSIRFTYESLPFEPNLQGRILTLRSTFTVPGIAKHHATIASFNYQDASGVYSNIIDIPEVNGTEFITRNQKIHNTLLTRYRFPIAYPDWEISTLAYIQRIKGGVFADFENLNYANGGLLTYGIELNVDANLLRLYLPTFDIGTKLILFNDPKKTSPKIELTLNIGF